MNTPPRYQPQPAGDDPRPGLSLEGFRVLATNPRPPQRTMARPVAPSTPLRPRYNPPAYRVVVVPSPDPLATARGLVNGVLLCVAFYATVVGVVVLLFLKGRLP